MLSSAQKIARIRAEALAWRRTAPHHAESPPPGQKTKQQEVQGRLHSYMRQADLRVPTLLAPALCLLCGALATVLLAHILSPYVLPLFTICGAALPLFWLEHRVSARAG